MKFLKLKNKTTDKPIFINFDLVMAFKSEVGYTKVYMLPNPEIETVLWVEETPDEVYEMLESLK